MYLDYYKMSPVKRPLIALACLVLVQTGLPAQPSRIAAKINSNQRFTLAGHVHPLAKSDYDQGPASASRQLNRVTLVLEPSEAQKADLEQLLAGQQDPNSANYHKWLTPEAYAGRFGVTQDDIDKITAWLQNQQLKVTAVARARNAVSVSGTVAQIESAFGTQIDIFSVNGISYYANTTNPTLPVAMQGIVRAVRGLHDFRMQPRSRQMTSLTVSANGRTPNYTSATSGSHYIAPDDFATIFNLHALYDAGITGAGQTIVVVGQSRITTGHLSTFRSYFGLPAVNLTTTLVPNTQDPGTSSSDAQESDLDLEWASAVARDASLIFVYSYDVFDAVQYAVDQNLAPVLSMSYGECESTSTRSDAATLQTWAKQAAAQGISWVAASGDSGAADCYQGTSSPFGPAATDLGLATDLPASVPEVTGVGGTTLTEGSGSYWNSTSDPTTKASAQSYIPETAWNDSTAGSPSASGGGASQFFSKPSWQTGAGVPSDGARDVPDIAFPASPDHDGYMVYTTSGRQASWYVFGGTSAGAPTFSGILSLLNQYLMTTGSQSTAGLGSVNAHLYSFAASTPAAFHDISTGDNIVTATVCQGFRCSGGSSTASVGFKAAAGYDQVTGLGSIDAYNFVTSWRVGALLAKGTPAMTMVAGPASLSAAGTVTLTAKLTSSISTTPTGTVTFSANGTTLGTASLSGSSGMATASVTIAGSVAGLVAGTNTVTADYAGDNAYNGASSSVPLTIVAASSTTPTITGVANAASYKLSYAPGMILAIFGTQLSLTTVNSSTAPLPVKLDNVSVAINGVAAPLYYISPGQLNVQIPYETSTTGTAHIVVSNNGQIGLYRYRNVRGCARYLQRHGRRSGPGVERRTRPNGRSLPDRRRTGYTGCGDRAPCRPPALRRRRCRLPSLP